jgi:hypothetical protein
MSLPLIQADWQVENSPGQVSLVGLFNEIPIRYIWKKGPKALITNLGSG